MKALAIFLWLAALYMALAAILGFASLDWGAVEDGDTTAVGKSLAALLLLALASGCFKLGRRTWAKASSTPAPLREEDNG